MTFEGGYDDRWILEDIVKDESYHLMVMSMGLSSIEDSNLRQLVSRMLSDVGHHVEQLAAISRATRHRVRQPAAPAPVQALGERPWPDSGPNRRGRAHPSGRVAVAHTAGAGCVLRPHSIAHHWPPYRNR